MKVYTLEREQTLKADLKSVWNFFSTPENLDEITPRDMGFNIITPRPLPSMYEGQIIEYKVSPVLNIPLYWKTKITKVDTNNSFIDEQLKGPYSLWRHYHSFEETSNGVVMKDKVEYSLPFGWLGRIVHKYYVKARLKEIFEYRAQVTERIFN